MRLLQLVVALAVLWAAAADPAAAWTWPASGDVLRPFVFADDPYLGGLHRGVDIAGEEAEPALAPASGHVSFAGSVPKSGPTVTIATADGYSVTLVHLAAVTVRRGQVVPEGMPVGVLGASAGGEWPRPYVHLGVRVTADPHGYVDPLTLLPPRPTSAAPGPPAVPVGAPAPVPAPPAPPAAALPPPQPVAASPAPVDGHPAVAPAHTAPPPAPPAQPARPGVTQRPAVSGNGAGSPSIPTPQPTASPAPPPAEAAQAPAPGPAPAGLATPAAAAASVGTVPPPPLPADPGPTGEPPPPAPPGSAPDVAAETLGEAAQDETAPAVGTPSVDAAAAAVRTMEVRRATPRLDAGGSPEQLRPAAVMAGHAAPTARLGSRRSRSADAVAEPAVARRALGAPRDGRRAPAERRLRPAAPWGPTAVPSGASPGATAAASVVLPVVAGACLLLALLAALARRRMYGRRTGSAVEQGERGLETPAVIQPAPCSHGGSRRRGSLPSCSGRATDDLLAALLAAPRSRPAPQAAFRGRSGRALVAAHRSRSRRAVRAR